MKEIDSLNYSSAYGNDFPGGPENVDKGVDNGKPSVGKTGLDDLIEILAAVVEADDPESVLDELSDEEVFEAPEDGLIVGIGGHGFASRFFRLWLKTDHLDFDFVVPAFNALDDDWEGCRENVRTLCRLACLALVKDVWFEDRARIKVQWDGFSPDGCSWRVLSSTGETVQEGDDWGKLADLLVEEPSEGLIRFDV